MGEKKERVLSEKELARKNRVDKIAEELAEKGYVRKDNVISILFANVMAIVLSIPFIALFAVWFLSHNSSINWEFSIIQPLLFIPATIILIVVHEAIHGLTWGLCAQSKFKSIEFGIIAENLTPYCYCGEPLKKSQYILGGFMPCLVLGIIPCIISVYINSIFLLILGIIMIIGAGGDLSIVLKMLFYKSSSNDVIIMDHPTECGFIIFER